MYSDALPIPVRCIQFGDQQHVHLVIRNPSVRLLAMDLPGYLQIPLARLGEFAGPAALVDGAVPGIPTHGGAGCHGEPGSGARMSE